MFEQKPLGVTRDVHLKRSFVRRGSLCFQQQLAVFDTHVLDEFREAQALAGLGRAKLSLQNVAEGHSGDRQISQFRR